MSLTKENDMGNLIATAIIVIALFVVLCPLVALLYKFIEWLIDLFDI